MTDGNDVILESLRADFASAWTISRTSADGTGLWKATRSRQLSDDDINRGLSQTLIYDTPRLLREALAAQTEIQGRMAHWNSAYL